MISFSEYLKPEAADNICIVSFTRSVKLSRDSVEMSNVFPYTTLCRSIIRIYNCNFGFVVHDFLHNHIECHCLKVLLSLLYIIECWQCGLILRSSSTMNFPFAKLFLPNCSLATVTIAPCTCD